MFEGTGCGEGLFCPGEPILRWVMAVWLVRVLGEAPAEEGGSRFADVDAGEWWAPYVEGLADLGVTMGCATDPLRFCPEESVKRAQMASFLVRAFGLEAAGSAGFVDTAGNTHEANIDALAAGGVTAGCATDPLRFCPEDSVKRAQMATFLARATGLVPLPGTEDGGDSVTVTPDDEVVAGFDPFTTPTLSDLDLDRLADAVATLDETVDCPPVVAPDLLDDVAEVVRIDGGCMIVEYEPLRGRTVAEVREALSADPTVHAVGVVPQDFFPSQATVSTPDELRDEQWHLGNVNAPALWNSWPTGTEVTVAVIDDGVDATHPDLVDRVLTTGHDCHRDPNGGHGTHVAGIIAAARDNPGGPVVGIAPEALILPIKIHYSDDFEVIDPETMVPQAVRDLTCYREVRSPTVAVMMAVNEGVDVINMSFGRLAKGGTTGQDTFELAVRAATMYDIVAVAAAGNGGHKNSPRMFPAAYPGVIAVAATDRNNERAFFSNSNRDVDIAAPGGGDHGVGIAVLSSWPDETTLAEDERCGDLANPGPDGTLTCWAPGTSMAAPIISGVVAHMKARMKAKKVEVSVNDIQYALYSTASNTDPSSSNFRHDYGHGFVNPLAAIGALDGLVLGVGDFKDVSGGESHSCGLRTDGTIDCWGNSDDGKLDAPERIFKKLATGANHSCGIRLNGVIECWGDKTQGRTVAPPRLFTDVSAGEFHSCGLLTDNTIECWGAAVTDKGQTKAPAGEFFEVSAGRLHTCGIRQPDGPSTATTVVVGTTLVIIPAGSIECWGDDTYKQISKIPTGTFTSVSAGGYHTCGIRLYRTVECWGANAHMQGNPPPGEFISVSAGWFHTCGIRPQGKTVACWGWNDLKQTDAPKEKFTAITAGSYHSCGVLKSETTTLTVGGTAYDIDSFGGVKCWGRNTELQAEAPRPGDPNIEATTVTASTQSNAIDAGLVPHLCHTGRWHRRMLGLEPERRG